MKILVADDESAVVSLLVEWLTSRGHEALGIPGSAGLPRWLIQQEYDVVILDVHLRNANGLWLISQLKAAAPSTAIVIISGDSDSSLAQIALNEGARHYLTKPIDLAMLDRALQEIARAKGRTL